MKKISSVFKAIGDETRLKMLALLLRKGELCVCDFVEVLGITHSKASRHLRYLHNSGLVADRRQGLWVHYRIASAGDNKWMVPIVEGLKKLIKNEMFEDLFKKINKWEKISGPPDERCGDGSQEKKRVMRTW